VHNVLEGVVKNMKYFFKESNLRDIVGESLISPLPS
jgi:hypothetical protein